MADGRNEAMAAGARIHYAVEYTDVQGRRRRARRQTLMGALSFKRGLRLGADAVIRIVTRSARAGA